MTILNETNSAQTFRFMPQGTSFDGATVLDELSGELTVLTLSNIQIPSTSGNYYYSFNAVFPTVENRFYIVKVYNGTDLVFYDKVFCTNQPLTSFAISNGQYTATSTNNEFIFYE